MLILADPSIYLYKVEDLEASIEADRNAHVEGVFREKPAHHSFTPEQSATLKRTIEKKFSDYFYFEDQVTETMYEYSNLMKK